MPNADINNIVVYKLQKLHKLKSVSKALEASKVALTTEYYAEHSALSNKFVFTEANGAMKVQLMMEI